MNSETNSIKATYDFEEETVSIENDVVKLEEYKPILFYNGFVVISRN